VLTVFKFNRPVRVGSQTNGDSHMTSNQKTLLAKPLLGLAFVFSLSMSATAQDVPPEKAIGLSGTGEAVALVDLAPHNLAG
jgi:uncharacterized protein YggE